MLSVTYHITTSSTVFKTHIPELTSVRTVGFIAFIFLRTFCWWLCLFFHCFCNICQQMTTLLIIFNTHCYDEVTEIKGLKESDNSKTKPNPNSFLGVTEKLWI